MKIEFHVERVYEACSSNVKTVDVPGLKMDIWLCVYITVKFWFLGFNKVYSVHLV